MTVRNVLWIMCDQLRFDYLGCYGHPSLQTPHIDKLASRGVRFTKAYVQSPVCGPARMSFYTGRYMRSHGSNWNNFPLRVGEPTLGEHLNKLGVRSALVGKTHMAPDMEGMQRLGIDPNSPVGVRSSQCGFEPYERDDGLHPDQKRKRPRYEQYLADQGYEGSNLWEQWANSAEDEKGNLLNGWLLKYANRPARIREEDSETPYMTRRAMDFMREAQLEGQPWLCHLSYIKPHWPYIVPSPYHNMYGESDLVPVRRHDSERENPHPVYKAFMEHRLCKTFQRDEVRQRVLPTYMGLIKQIDDQIGELMSFMDESGLNENTMIVFSSDHGDYLGDHWLGEKDLFHEQSVKVPLIIVDPSEDAAHGVTCDALVEGIDLAPTFIETLGGKVEDQVLEGLSLTPWLRGAKPDYWRQAVYSEYDYS
ncbi:MAG: sulfatase-like hydrolase/transferase, partial [Methyloligellaceae bacterium]